MISTPVDLRVGDAVALKKGEAAAAGAFLLAVLELRDLIVREHATG